MTTTTAVATRFHVGLFASDLARSVKFYRTLFGCEPTKQFAEYARFEINDPPLVLTLKPHRAKGGGPLNHVGIRLGSSELLVEIQRRLEENAIPTQRQEGVECCYAKQTKFWATDPDRVLWELYVLEEDIDHSGFDDPPLPQVAEAPVRPEGVWEHRLSDPFPERLPFTDGALDEVQLSGTLNAMVGAAETARRLSEVQRVLRTGGRVVVLGLMGDKPYDKRLDLPGQASKCEYLPVESEPLNQLAQAGFEGVFYEKLHDVNCLSVAEIDLRSFRLIGRRGASAAPARDQMVMYKGPFASVTGEQGTIFPRGKRVYVSTPLSEVLRSGPAADQFVFFGAARPSPFLTITSSNCCSR